MKALFIAISFLFAVSANAALITPAADTVSINDISVPAGATVSVNGQDVALKTVMVADRQVSLILGLTTDVYHIQFMVDQPEALVVKSADGNAVLDAVEATQSVVAVKLDFIVGIGVQPGQLQGAFVEALTANKVDLKAPENKTFLKNVFAGGGAAYNTSIIFLVTKNADGTETVAYENSKGQDSSVSGPAGFGKNILSMWLGNINPKDSFLMSTKTQLIKSIPVQP